MRPKLSRKTIIVLAGSVVILASLTLGLTKGRSVIRRRDSITSDSRQHGMPSVILWAWERPTDLRYINPREIGVAFLAKTIRLRGQEVTVRPRLQPLNLPEGAGVIAVARVETDAIKKAELSNQQSQELAAVIVEMAQLPRVSRIQIDFDATRSERQFYRDVIFNVRGRLPDHVGLSITALASWCTYDDWISDLPIDEAVPMLFRMGVEERQFSNRLESGEDFKAAPCRLSYGVSTDEPRTNLFQDRRLYVFNPDPWTDKSVRAILESRK
jgi:hypothetical protein